MKKILTFIFGERAVGEILSQPAIRTIAPSNRPSENDWAKEYKFGSRYGHRGSYYTTR